MDAKLVIHGCARLKPRSRSRGGAVCYGVRCYGMVWCGVLWYGKVPYGMVWYDMFCYGQGGGMEAAE